MRLPITDAPFLLCIRMLKWMPAYASLPRNTCTQDQSCKAPNIVGGALMELIIPPSMTVTIGAIIAFLTIFASIIGIYYRLTAQVGVLEKKFDQMAQRNVHADQETEAVKREQAAQKTTVAVMAEQISAMGRTLERIDRNVDDLVKEGRK